MPVIPDQIADISIQGGPYGGYQFLVTLQVSGATFGDAMPMFLNEAGIDPSSDLGKKLLSMNQGPPITAPKVKVTENLAKLINL